MSRLPWEFWIDVGGTFCDVIARRPDRTLWRHKVLSSGVIKGAVGPGSDVSCVIDQARGRDPPSFWDDYQLSLLDRGGHAVAKARVCGFDRAAGRLHLAHPLDVVPAVGQAYEMGAGEEAPILAIRYLAGIRLSGRIPPAVVRLGTTRGTNALITRRGAKTALVTTRGFGDILLIGYQDRPKLFELAIKKREPLFAATVEIDQRVTPAGEVLAAPDPHAVQRQLLKLKRQGVESLAICLLHGHAHPAHEQLVGRVARQVGFREISLSSRIAPLMKIVSRGDTTVVDAYLNPVLRDYVATLRESLRDPDSPAQGSVLQILTSAGGLVDADRFVGKDSILSGPAGGVVGFARAAQAAGFDRAIGFDMGGTSTDVSRFDGEFQLEYETQKAGVRVVAPMMAIETVAAGGGSICHFDGVKLAVGPDSAAADPGPACYGRGGPLAVTDLNLFLGKIPADRFPFPLDATATKARLTALRDDIASTTGKRYTLVELAEGLLRVANENMAQAIRSISLAKGADPRQYILVSFGGAGPQHACAVARLLGISRVLNHPDSGILSALGIGLADVIRHRARGVYQPYGAGALAELEMIFEHLTGEAREEVRAEGVTDQQMEIHRLLELRYQGLDATLTVPFTTDTDGAAAYAAEHQRRYGYTHPDRALEIVAARVQVTGRTSPCFPQTKRVPGRTARPTATTTAHFQGKPCPTSLFERTRLEPGSEIVGPAIVCDPTSTTLVDPLWRAEVLSGGELLLTDTGAAPPERVSTRSDPIMLEVFNRQFAAIAQQMGIVLKNTAISVNVKERLDFSCAVFTASGDLVVNAPHIPVHLGAMAATVRRTIRDNPRPQPGDVFVTNDPYRGGSHLPDVTVITPLHDADSGRLVLLTASRAHHAEIGGMRPGSMPPESTNLAEEGVLIRNFKLVDRGRSCEDALRGTLLSADYPTRNVDDNLADIRAQVAANRQGANDLAGLIRRYTLPVVEAYMRHIQVAAEKKMRAALARIPGGQYQFVDHLDDGSPVAVTITVAKDRACVDFAGTGPVMAGNLNTNRAIVTAAVMYCLRALIDEDIPLNQGMLSPVEICLPECLLNPPEGLTARDCPAVAGGNVETSQRIVDVLLGALGLAAASQGTMNNLLFGNETFGYYETICGGAGATPTAPGADAVHTHMTNTRLTDPEVLESRFPVRVHRFHIRHGSGGNGAMAGGDGVVRQIEFLRDVEVSILAQRRGPYPPYGLAGGAPGALGRNTVTRKNGQTQVLPGQVQLMARRGDLLTIETPGGGGFGEPQRGPRATA